MFGGEQRQHDERYAFGQEWLDFATKLWTEPGSFSFDTASTSTATSCSRPTPSRTKRHGPALINAGNSQARHRVLRAQR